MKTMKLAALGAALIAIPATAFATLSAGDQVGTTFEAVIAKLTDAGYEIQEVEREDGGLEVEAVLNGTTYEIMIDGETGAVMEIEVEDDDEDDD